jgi:phenylpropionate dioxygenase-like ring-hydroxylating dioxygenase large terminal subunit
VFSENENSVSRERGGTILGSIEHHPDLGTGLLSFARVRAFHNVCRHRGNRLLWEGTPRGESNARQLVCKYHGWRYGLDGACTYVHQEDQFFGLRKEQLGLAPVHCDTWAGFVFVNLDREPRQYAVEVWKQPEVVHCGSARIDRILEPRP